MAAEAPKLETYKANYYNDVFGLKMSQEEATRRAQADYGAAMKIWDEGASQRRESEWQESGLGETYGKLGESTEAALMKAYNRQIGQMQGKLGYYASSGAGSSGYWPAAEVALQGKAAGQLADAAGASERIEAQAKAGWINKEDAQAFQMESMEVQHQYRMAELNRQAELNDSSWWQDFGSIIGIALPIALAPFTGGTSLLGLAGSGGGGGGGSTKIPSSLSYSGLGVGGHGGYSLGS